MSAWCQAQQTSAHADSRDDPLGVPPVGTPSARGTSLAGVSANDGAAQQSFSEPLREPCWVVKLKNRDVPCASTRHKQEQLGGSSCRKLKLPSIRIHETPLSFVVRAIENMIELAPTHSGSTS